MKAITAAAIFTAILFIGCETKTAVSEDQDNLENQDTSKVVQKQEQIISDDTIKSDDDELPSFECIRGQAERIIKASIYPNTTFKVNADSLTGIETVDFENGEKLVINNRGCEYFVLTFTFETERFQADTTNTKYWLDKVTVLMSEIENGIDAPLDIHGGTLAIENLIREKRAYSLGEEIVYDDSEIRDYVALDRIHKINDRKFAIEISYAKGPL